MRALLLAAGLGTRLRPLTDTIPKCLVPIVGRPLLDYWLEALLSSSIEKVLINTHYLPDRVEKFIATSRWKNQVELVYEKELLGTGGTILKNQSFFQNTSFLVAHADNLTVFNTHKFIECHAQRSSDIVMTMMTFETDVPHLCGIVDVDENNIVRAFYEKVKNPPSMLANGAVYILDPSILSLLKQFNKETLDLSLDVIPHFMGRINTYHNTVYHRDIGNIEALHIAEKEFKSLQLYFHEKVLHGTKRHTLCH